MKNAKKSILLIVLSYPIAYFLTTVFQLLSVCIKYFVISIFSEGTAIIISQLFPSVSVNTSIIALVICINAFAVMLRLLEYEKGLNRKDIEAN